MKKEEQKQRGAAPSRLKNYCVIISSIVIILAGIHAASGLLGPFLMAAFFAVLLISPVDWLCRRGIAPWLSLTVVVIGVLVIGVGAATLIGSQIAQFARDLPEYRNRFVSTLENYNLDLGDVIPFLKEEPFNEKSEDGAAGKDDLRNDGAVKKTRATRPSPRAEQIADLVAPENAAIFDKDENDDSAKAGAKVAENAEESPRPATAEPEASNDSAKNSARTESVAQSSSSREASETTLETERGGRLSSPEVVETRLLPTRPEILKDGSLFSDDPTVGYDDEYDALENDENDEGKSPALKAVTLSSQQLFRFLTGLAGELSYFASSALIITLLLVFMLIETAKIPRKLVAALGEREFKNTHILKVVGDIRHYMVIKTQVSLLVGVFVTILLVFSNVEYPLLWGFVAFLLNYIPNIGSVVAAVPPLVLATVEHGVVTGCVDAVGFIVINCTIGYVLEPRLLGRGLDLSPLIVLISLLFFGWLLGPVGMFLAPPLAVISKIIFQSFPETKWIAALMANTAPKDVDEDDGQDEPTGEGAA